MIRKLFTKLRRRLLHQDETRHRLRSVKVGSLLVRIGQQAQLTEAEFSVFEQIRDKEPARQVSFE